MDTETLTPIRRGISDGSPFTQIIESAMTAAPGFIATIVDVGAGVGNTTEPIRAISPDLAITAYEPLPENVRVLSERFTDAPNVVVRPVALTDAPGQARFAVPSRLQADSGFWATDTAFGGFVVRRHPRYWARVLLYSVRRRLHGGGKSLVTVPTLRLDAEFDTPPDAIKLDLQGGELDALRGAGALLPRVKLLQLELQCLRGKPERHQLLETLWPHFTLHLADLQFEVPTMSAELRDRLFDFGVSVDLELSDGPFADGVLVIGRWSSSRAFQGMDLVPEFAQLLRGAKVGYFQTDVVALNRRHEADWRRVLGAL